MTLMRILGMLALGMCVASLVGVFWYFRRKIPWNKKVDDSHD